MIKVLMLPGNLDFAASLQTYLNRNYPGQIDFIDVRGDFFANGEPNVKIDGSIRGSQVFVVSPNSATYPFLDEKDLEKRVEDAYAGWSKLNRTKANRSALQRLVFGLTGIEIGADGLDQNFVRTLIARQFKTSINDNAMLWLATMDAAKRADAAQIVPVASHSAYARMDRKPEPRVPITAKLMADMTQAACGNRFGGLITSDLHVPQIQGFYDGPVDDLPMDSLHAADILAYLSKNNLTLNDIILISPDVGGEKRIEKIADALNASGMPGFCEIAVHKKVRLPDGKTVVSKLLQDHSEADGVARGKIGIFVDDIFDSGKTACEAGKAILSTSFGLKSLQFRATHGVLSDGALQNLGSSPFTQVVLSDSIPMPPHMRVLEGTKIRRLSVAPLFAETIMAKTRNDGSVSKFFSVQALRTIYSQAGIPLGGQTLG